MQQQGAKPTIFSLIVLYVVSGFVGPGRVLLHDVIVHQSFTTEERETSRTTEYATDHVLGGLLEPMTNGVLEFLVPYQRTRTNRMDTTAGSSQILVFLHQIDQELYGCRLEVDVTVQSEEEGVLGYDFFTVDAYGELHESVTQKVVHVHHLAPTLPVPDLTLVLQMSYHLRLSRKRPDKSSTVRRDILLGRSHVHPGLMHVRSCLVQGSDQKLDEPIDLTLVVVVVSKLEGVVEEYVG